MPSFLYTVRTSYIPYFSDPSFQNLNNFVKQSQCRITRIFNISSSNVDAVINYILTELENQKVQDIKIENLTFVEIDATIPNDNGNYTQLINNETNQNLDVALLTSEQIDLVATKDQIIKINDVLETIIERLKKLENPVS